MAAMAGILARRRHRTTATLLLLSATKTTSAQHVAARPRDPTFEKLMDNYKHLLKVVAVRDLILASPSRSLPLAVLSSAAQRLRLNRGATHFVRTFPHPLVGLTPSAGEISRQESSAASSSAPTAAARLERLLSMSPSRSLPLRAVFRVWRELGLPDDFEDSVIRRHGAIFSLQDNPREPNTHVLKLIDRNPNPNPSFTPAVEEWRSNERSKSDEMEIKFAFKQGFPPGMRFSKNFRARVKGWQRLPYAGPYTGGDGGPERSKAGMRAMEKRAVGIAHEFLSLTVEKMVEVEKMSHFRKWFGMELNVRDLFIDHPGIFYLSTKGKQHTVFLREGYDRGRLIESCPVYEARRRLLELVLLRRRGMVQPEGLEKERLEVEVEDEEEEDMGVY